MNEEGNFEQEGLSNEERLKDLNIQLELLKRNIQKKQEENDRFLKEWKEDSVSTSKTIELYRREVVMLKDQILVLVEILGQTKMDLNMADRMAYKSGSMK